MSEPNPIEQARLLARISGERPSYRYRPGRAGDLDGNPIPAEENGQLQFHKAPHIIRVAAPGNGWGKTAAIAVEIDWWGFGDHPWASDLPIDRPRQLVWIAQKHQQWDLLRIKVEQWWPEAVVKSWVGNPHYRYTWPDGTRLSIITAETEWTTVQGIEPDLVVADEEIPVALAREMLKRRRGKTRTKYVFAGTATQVLHWVHAEQYMPWKRFHEARGISEEREMMRLQMHDYSDVQPDLKGVPGIWCWPQGSHRDNPTATKETWAFYLATTTGSEAERAVRLFGGFRDFAGSCVFAEANLLLMRSFIERGRQGVVEMAA